MNKLVYYEEFENPYDSITREKQLKKWNREWKIRLIDKENPFWIDLYYTMGGREFEEDHTHDIIEDSNLDSRFRGND